MLENDSAIQARPSWQRRVTQLPWSYIVIFLMSAVILPYVSLSVWDKHVNLPPIEGILPISIAAYTVLSAIAIGIAYSKEVQRKASSDNMKKLRIQAIEELQQEIRSLGNESEALVGQTALILARELDPKAWLETGMILQYPKSRPGQMSRFEIDCLLVTRFGTFIIEVKNWKNPVSISPDGWQIHKPEGTEAVKSPLAQSAPKFRVIRDLATQASKQGVGISVYSAVVLSHQNAQFPMNAPREVLYLADLRYYLRMAYLRAEKAGFLLAPQIEQFKVSLRHLQDSSADAKHRFLLELAEKNSAAAEYRELEQKKQTLLLMPATLRRPVWRNWITYIPPLLLLALTVIASQFGPTQSRADINESQPAHVQPKVKAKTANTRASNHPL